MNEKKIKRQVSEQWKFLDELSETITEVVDNLDERLRALESDNSPADYQLDQLEARIRNMETHQDDYPVGAVLDQLETRVRNLENGQGPTRLELSQYYAQVIKDHAESINDLRDSVRVLAGYYESADQTLSELARHTHHTLSRGEIPGYPYIGYPPEQQKAREQARERGQQT